MSSVPQDAVSMLALAIRDDQPIDPEQPPLIDGVHLRWMTLQELGFPWYGYYLFRRETNPRRKRCLGGAFAALQPRSGTSATLVTQVGTLSSAQPIVYTDDFAPQGRVEADLRAPLRFALPDGVDTDSVEVTIGFRGRESTRTCVDFRTLGLGAGPNPRIERGAVFTVQPVLVAAPAPEAAIEAWSGVASGLEFTSPVAVTYRLDVALPCNAQRVDLLLSNRAPIRIEAFENGAATGTRPFDAGALTESKVSFSGQAITRLAIECSQLDAVLLHEICWACGTAPPPREIDVDFREWQPGQRPSPLVEKEVVFTAERFAFDTVAAGAGMVVRGDSLTVELPCATDRVELHFTRVAATGGTLTVTPAGQTGAPVEVSTPGEVQVVVTGSGMTELGVATTGLAFLHRVVLTCSGAASDSVEVRGVAASGEVVSVTASGTAGATETVTLSGAGLTAVEIGSGRAALIDLCYVPRRQATTFGWEAVPEFQYPLCLPVAHDDYPCAGRPSDPNAARTLALSRVTYPSPDGLGQGFWRLHSELVRLVRHGPAGGEMADRVHPLLHGSSASPAMQDAPAIPNLRPLDLVYLASLHPAYAQMLGLYFVDRNTGGERYDYLVLGDPTGVLGGSAESALQWLAFDADSSQVHADIVLDQRVEPRPAITAPAGVRAYALPGPAARAIDGTVPDVAGNVGLWWPPPPDEATEPQPDQPVFYFARRAALGPARPASAPPDADYLAVAGLGPVVLSEPDPPPPPPPTESRSPDWPPPSVRFHAVDGNLAEGWYSYRLTGQDLFGRRSALGPPAEWYEWDPEQVVDPFAVALLDKMPPPAPLGVEAWALDPDDRWIFADDAYDAWRATVAPGLVGLRVRWRWTHLQQVQAPDTTEFRLYWKPGRWNALLGTIASVTAASATESDVELDFGASNPANAFAGTRLRVGNSDFAVIASQSGASLRLRVKNIGPDDDVAPGAGQPCTIAIPEHHALWTDTGLPPSWSQRLAVVPYASHQRTVVDVTKDLEDRPLSDDVFNQQPLAINASTAKLPGHPALGGLQPWIDHLWLRSGGQEEYLRIVRFDTLTSTVTLEAGPTLPADEWAIGRPAREYEVFLAAPDTGAGHPFEPTLGDTVVYAQVAVSAADDRPHAADTFSGGNRPGNESRVSPSATVYRVWQKKPDAPELPPGDDWRFATPADYRDQSLTTFRFMEAAHLRVHVLRALDETLFQQDWSISAARGAIDPADDTLFPSDWPQGRRAAAAAEINQLAALEQYAALGNDALRVLASHPANEEAFTQVTIAPLEMGDARIRDERRPDDDAGYVAAAGSGICAYTDVLPGRASNRYLYRAQFVDGAQNQGALSVAGPPVYLRKVEPPRVPVITGVRSGERTVTVQWAAQRDPRLAFYRLYRTAEPAHAGDVRLMDAVATLAPSDLDPLQDPEFTDAIGLVGGQVVHYRLTAIDTAGNESQPSRPAPAMVVDSTPPPAPNLTAAEWLLLRERDGALAPWRADGVVPEGYRPALRLEWESAAPQPTFEVARRRSDDRVWATVAGAPEPAPAARRYRLVDGSADATADTAYRLRVRSLAGVWSVDAAVAPVGIPVPPAAVVAVGASAPSTPPETEETQ
jgi:hypothetical protein